MAQGAIGFGYEGLRRGALRYDTTIHQIINIK